MIIIISSSISITIISIILVVAVVVVIIVLAPFLTNIKADIKPASKSSYEDKVYFR